MLNVQRIRSGCLWIMTIVSASILVHVTVDYLHVLNEFSLTALQFFLKF
jgi:hypothetical protein